MIPRDKPWEGNYLHYTTVFYDEQEQQFRLWYTSSNHIPAPGDNPDSTEPIQCYATSRDGFTGRSLLWAWWSSKVRSRTTSWMRRVGSVSKVAFSSPPGRRTPGKRYKGLVMTGTSRGAGMTFDLYTSPDAFNWTPYPQNPVIDWGDRKGRWGPTAMMDWDPTRQVYAAHMEVGATPNSAPCVGCVSHAKCARLELLS